MDETFDMCRKGHYGVVTYLEYECGCGQNYPSDPMIGVCFDDGYIDEFWIEEFDVISLSELNN